MFMLVRTMNNMSKKKEEKPAAPPEIPADIKLLTDIRDLLKKQRA
jgi:large conductance mechanosensitive channel